MLGSVDHKIKPTKLHVPQKKALAQIDKQIEQEHICTHPIPEIQIQFQ